MIAAASARMRAGVCPSDAATSVPILSNEPNAASRINQSLPSELDLILKKALEKDRELRYQTGSDYRADIRRILRIVDSAATSSNPTSITTSSESFILPG